MKSTFSKVMALALAGVMSFGTIAAAPAAAFAEEGPAIEAQAVTSYYNYGDWRIDQLNRLASYANRSNSVNAAADVTAINNAISSIRNLSYYSDWDYWGIYNGYGYGMNNIAAGNLYLNSTYSTKGVDYTAPDYLYTTKYEKNQLARANAEYYYGNRYAYYGTPYAAGYYYGNGYGDGYYYYGNGYGNGVYYYGDRAGNGYYYIADRYANLNWDVRYNDYIRSVDNIVYSCVSSLSPDVRNYFYNTIDREYWGYSNWNDYYRYWYRGDRYYTYTEKTVASTDVYRLTKNGEHAYTASSAVRDTFISQGWTSEGTGWKAPLSEGDPVYQVSKGGKYFYTKDATERDNLVASGWTNDGVAFYSYKENKNKPVYRLYNGGKHFFTSSTSERDSLVGRGWTNEGVAFYAM